MLPEDVPQISLHELVDASNWSDEQLKQIDALRENQHLKDAVEKVNRLLKKVWETEATLKLIQLLQRLKLAGQGHLNNAYSSGQSFCSDNIKSTEGEKLTEKVISGLVEILQNQDYEDKLKEWVAKIDSILEKDVWTKMSTWAGHLHTGLCQSEIKLKTELEKTSRNDAELTSLLKQVLTSCTRNFLTSGIPLGDVEFTVRPLAYDILCKLTNLKLTDFEPGFEVDITFSEKNIGLNLPATGMPIPQSIVFKLDHMTCTLSQAEYDVHGLSKYEGEVDVVISDASATAEIVLSASNGIPTLESVNITQFNLGGVKPAMDSITGQPPKLGKLCMPNPKYLAWSAAFKAIEKAPGIISNSIKPKLQDAMGDVIKENKELFNNNFSQFYQKLIPESGSHGGAKKRKAATSPGEGVKKQKGGRTPGPGVS